jgi:Domain of unknown function (DUF1735)
MINFIKKSIVALSLVVIVASCDKSHDDNFALSKDPKSVGFNYANSDLNVLAITPTGTSITVDMGKIFLSSPSTVDEELTVKIILNNTLISNYNTTNSTSYVDVPGTNLQLPLTYSIKKGQQEVPVVATINLAGLDLSKSYAIGASIASVTGRNDVTINRAYENLLFATIIKNKYDGVYTLTGNTMVDVANATFVGTYPLTFEFITTGSDEVLLIDQDNLGIPGHLFSTPTGPSFYGNFGMKFKFDPATDKAIAVTNSYGQPGPGPQFRYASIDPGGVNQWNSTNKNLKIKYRMHQNAVVPTPPNIRVTFDENFNYVGPR